MTIHPMYKGNNKKYSIKIDNKIPSVFQNSKDQNFIPKKYIFLLNIVNYTNSFFCQLCLTCITDEPERKVFIIFRLTMCLFFKTTRQVDLNKHIDKHLQTLLQILTHI